MLERIALHHASPVTRLAWTTRLAAAGYEVVSGVEAQAWARMGPAWSAAVIDGADPAAGDVLRAVRLHLPGVPVLATLPRAEPEYACRLLTAGADDLLVGESIAERLATRVGVLVGRTGLIAAEPGDQLPTGMHGGSTAMQEVFRTLALAAADDRTVLIRGPSGSGKSLAAWMVHRLGRTAAQPFLSCDARITPSGQLGELVRAAASAERGTLVIDGAPLVPESLLAQVDRPGLRVVLLADRGGAGAWDSALAVAHRIDLPPLRERPMDIPGIARHLLQRQADRLGRRLTITPEVVLAWQRHHWPGNVRELVDVLAEAVASAPDGTIRREHLGMPGGGAPGELDLRLGEAAELALERHAGEALARWQAFTDRPLLARCLDRVRGNYSAAAQLLGLHRATLRKRCDELGIGV